MIRHADRAPSPLAIPAASARGPRFFKVENAPQPVRGTTVFDDRTARPRLTAAAQLGRRESDIDPQRTSHVRRWRQTRSNSVLPSR